MSSFTVLYKILVSNHHFVVFQNFVFLKIILCSKLEILVCLSYTLSCEESTSSLYICRNMGTSDDLFRFYFTMFRHTVEKKKRHFLNKVPRKKVNSFQAFVKTTNFIEKLLLVYWKNYWFLCVWCISTFIWIRRGFSAYLCRFSRYTATSVINNDTIVSS